ncbi:DMT family transporter [Fictibacillus sp. KIGAM418]|uniref:DMT family transporter n=1 Tax=Fictibacillus marinisediminis TaxID=2878389 RepID=A0A9X2BAU6_9BACL|nr:DMT family transporter [Fictibacillus marinisediminis]MCK6255249.1 DMT family transporter [Fictibacillus marinisediminis]
MAKVIVLLLALFSGMGQSMQAAVNGTLGKKIGSIEGAFVSFFTGTVMLLILMLIWGNGSLSTVWNVPKWNLIGGVLGAIYVFIVIMAVPKIGVTSAITAVIIGQLIMSVVIDHFGWFGNEPFHFTYKRMIGLVLMFAGLYFVFSDKH